MKGRIGLGLLIAVLLSFSCFAYPLSADFQAHTGAAALESCACNFFSYNISVYNTGSFESAFRVLAEGKLARYITIIPDRFTLKAGEWRSVGVFVNVPCNVKGVYELKTRISNDMNVEKVLTQQLRVKKCPAAQLNMSVVKGEGCRCDGFEYRVRIYNPGFYPEIYTLSIPMAEAEFSKNNLELKPGQSEELMVSFTPPCAWDSRDVPLIISTKYTGQRLSLGLPIIVNSSCSVKPYEPFRLGWEYLLALALFIFIIFLIVAIVLVIRRKRRVRGQKKPKLIRFKIAEKEELALKPRAPIFTPERRKWLWRIIIVLFLIALWAGIGYWIYTLVSAPAVEREESIPRPPMFEIVQEELGGVYEEPAAPTEQGAVTPLCVWLLVALGAILVLLILLRFVPEFRGKPAVRRALILLLVSIVLVGAAYYAYTLVTNNWEAIAGFFALYKWYFVAGFVILAVLLFVSWLRGRRNSGNKGYVCNLCGRIFTTKSGLTRHKKASH